MNTELIRFARQPLRCILFQDYSHREPGLSIDICLKNHGIIYKKVEAIQGCSLLFYGFHVRSIYRLTALKSNKFE